MSLRFFLQLDWFPRNYTNQVRQDSFDFSLLQWILVASESNGNIKIFKTFYKINWYKFEIIFVDEKFEIILLIK